MLERARPDFGAEKLEYLVVLVALIKALRAVSDDEVQRERERERTEKEAWPGESQAESASKMAVRIETTDGGGSVAHALEAVASCPSAAIGDASVCGGRSKPPETAQAPARRWHAECSR
jgi:hypothetical protein